MTQPLIEKFLGGPTAEINFSPRRCLRSRFNKNNCKACLTSCRSAALVLDKGQIKFNAAKCTHCAQCTSVCPNDAFIHTTDFTLILKALAERKTVVLSCERSNHDHVTIPCIGLFSEPFLAAINSVAKGNYFIDIRRCDECVNNHCLQTLELNIRNLIEKIEETSKIKVKFIRGNEKPNVPSDKKVERRSFLKLAGKTITNVSKDVADVIQPHSSKEANAHDKHPVRITSVLQYALSSLPEERTRERDVLLSYFFSVSTNGKCDCCPLCTGMCPTGALKRKKENDKKSLTFTSGKCSGCGLCNDFCKKQALILRNGFHGDPNISQKISDQ